MSQPPRETTVRWVISYCHFLYKQAYLLAALLCPSHEKKVEIMTGHSARPERFSRDPRGLQLSGTLFCGQISTG